MPSFALSAARYNGQSRRVEVAKGDNINEQYSSKNSEERRKRCPALRGQSGRRAAL